MLVKVSLVQHEVGTPISLDLKLHLFRKQPDFICLPEYWGARSDMAGQVDLAAAEASQRAEIIRLSAVLSATLIGGTVVTNRSGELHNTAPVYAKGEFVGDYNKRFPTQREQERGIVPGSGPGVWALGPVRVGVAICADCLHPETFDACAAEEIDILFVPNASPHKPDESVADKFNRDEEIFVAGAKRAGAYVVKTCGVGQLFGGRLQGRSLVAAPWGVIHRVPPEEEDLPQVITVNLSLDELHEFRRVYSAAPANLPA